MVINKLNHLDIDDLIVGQKYIITRSDDTKWYIGFYEKIDKTDETDIDIPFDPEIIPEVTPELNPEIVSEDFDILYAWFKNVTFESEDVGDIGFPISKVLVYNY